MSFVKTKHWIYLPGALDVKIEMMLPDIYADLSDATGINPPTVIYNPKLRLSVGEMRVNGLIAKVNIRTESGKSHEIVCATEKLSTALANLVGKKVPEQSGTDVVYKKITKAGLPRKRDRY
jgi:hypothetical protein